MCLALLALGCAPKVPAWALKPPVEAGAYHGVGHGPDLESARTTALGDLCKTLASEVRATGRASEGERGRGDQREGWLDVEDATSVTGDCSFRGLPVETKAHAEAGAQHWLLLRLDLFARRVRLAGDLSGAAEVRAALARMLARRGYVLLRSGASDAPFSLESTVDVQVREGGPAGLVVAEAKPQFRLVRVADGVEVETLASRPVVGQGFTAQSARADAVARIAAALSE